MMPSYDQQTSRVHRDGPPPIGADGRQVELPAYGLVKPPHARRLQSEAMGTLLGRAGRGLLAVSRTLGVLISCAGAGAAKRVPDGLTSPCR